MVAGVNEERSTKIVDRKCIQKLDGSWRCRGGCVTSVNCQFLDWPHTCKSIHISHAHRTLNSLKFTINNHKLITSNKIILSNFSRYQFFFSGGNWDSGREIAHGLPSSIWRWRRIDMGTLSSLICQNKWTISSNVKTFSLIIWRCRCQMNRSFAFSLVGLVSFGRA